MASLSGRRSPRRSHRLLIMLLLALALFASAADAAIARNSRAIVSHSNRVVKKSRRSLTDVGLDGQPCLDQANPLSQPGLASCAANAPGAPAADMAPSNPALNPAMGLSMKADARLLDVAADPAADRADAPAIKVAQPPPAAAVTYEPVEATPTRTASSEVTLPPVGSKARLTDAAIHAELGEAAAASPAMPVANAKAAEPTATAPSAFEDAAPQEHVQHPATITRRVQHRAQPTPQRQVPAGAVVRHTQVVRQQPAAAHRTSSPSRPTVTKTVRRVASVPASPATGTPQAIPMTATPPDAWAQACMEEHNRLRRKFGKADLQWSPRAASYAQIWSNILNARQTGLAHSHGMFPGYGENLYSGTPSCRDAVRAWGAEAPLYNGEPIGTGDFEGYGHFTQAIWPDTTAVGCAISGVTITCEYYPAGNFQGEVVSKH